MKIASWNVNSLRARQDQVLDWVEQNRPDVLCMQETKLTDQEFPIDELGDLSYDVVFQGQRSYNGVAIASLDEPKQVLRGLPGDVSDDEKRLIAASFGDVRVICVYVPNGQELGSEKYLYKLAWLERLILFVKAELEQHKQLVLCGDFNIGRAEIDLWDAAERGEGLFASKAERSALQRLLDLGLYDSFRERHPGKKTYSWWDYRGSSFERNKGMRIDLMLITRPLLERTRSIEIERAPRAHPQPSDHVPVVLELDD